MRTPVDIVDILWGKINSSSLKSALATGGGVYKRQRPINSNKEDVVINSLPLLNEQLQVGVANVNIHVPDKQINQVGIQTTVANTVRLKALVDTAVTILKEDYSADDYHFEIQQVSDLMKDEDASSHFINIRIEFYSLNISN